MPVPYTPTTWVDDDGSGNGTVITAARMNNIETGVKAVADASGSGGGGSTALIDGGNATTNHSGNLRIDFGSAT